MKTSIHISDLSCWAIIGEWAWEREKPQELIFDIEIGLKTCAACDTDRLEDTLDYDTLVRAIIGHVESSAYHLLEKAGAEVAKLILKDSIVEKVRVFLNKPSAAGELAGITVNICMNQEDLDP